MRVLQVHNAYQHRGGEDVVVDIEYELLSSRGVIVEQLLFTNDQINPRELIYNSDAAAVLKEKITSFQPDVIHAHNLFYKASPSILYEARRHGVPVVMTLHNFRLICPNAMFLRDNAVCTKCLKRKFAAPAITHKCFKDSRIKSGALATSLFVHNTQGTWRKQVDRFTVLTPFIRDLILSSSLRLSEEKVEVKPNSTEDLGPVNSADNRIGDYLYIGRLSAEKGLDTLVEAFNLLPELRLSILGEGPLMEELRAKAGPNIEFAGTKDRTFVQAALKDSKALLFTSVIFEGLPNTIIEAFSAGTPVIASDVDNINQIVTDGNNGRLFEASNPERLAQVIRDFDEERPAALYQGARQTYERKYTHGHNFEALMQVYRSVINSDEEEDS